MEISFQHRLHFLQHHFHSPPALSTSCFSSLSLKSQMGMEAAPRLNFAKQMTFRQLNWGLVSFSFILEALNICNKFMNFCTIKSNWNIICLHLESFSFEWKCKSKRRHCVAIRRYQECVRLEVVLRVRFVIVIAFLLYLV